MMKINSRFFVLLTATASFLPPIIVQAVCPVCTVAVGAGVGLARYFGVEDTISGTWIGGLVISLAIWTASWLERKNWKIKNAEVISVVFYYLIVVIPLYSLDIIGHPFNKLCGVDKLLLGIISGSLGFVLGHKANLILKKRNEEKVYFPFQKVVFGVAPLLILSLVFYIISKC